MVTTVGLDSDFDTVLKDLISLDYDAADAYQSAIDRLDTPSFKQALSDFREDHLRHIRELSAIVRHLGLEAPTGPDIKVALTKGKVVVADLFGDEAILRAMKTNEDDTNTAYERAFHHKNMVPLAREVVERGLADERRHRAAIIDMIGKLSHKAA